MNRRTTITDVARASGVSPATVSRVLNGNPRVAPDLVERVEAAIREANYRPNGAGRALRRQRADLWAAIIPDVRNPFFHRLVSAFEEIGHEHGYSVMLCNTQEDLARERSAIDAVIGHQVSGVLIAAVSGSRSSLKPLQLQGVPVVSIDREVSGFSGDCVNVDNASIGRMAAQHLLEQGWRNPVVLCHHADLSPLEARERGFVAAMHAAGQHLPQSHLVQVPFQSSEAAALIRAAVEDPEVDAVFATTNTLTSMAYRALRDAGRTIGEDVGLIGVDDDRWNDIVDPAVTVIEQPAEHLGQWAAQLLLGRTTGNAAQSARMLLEPTLIVRRSSLRPVGVAV